ncbi:hypothetical protein [Legionella sp. CNM-4043-24]|uniref:hypothetical protein n=1 Tax=Legionella sp. CNM-4043-24 TaxID=3421646 RepID=UPI00403B2678
MAASEKSLLGYHKLLVATDITIEELRKKQKELSSCGSDALQTAKARVLGHVLTQIDNATDEYHNRYSQCPTDKERLEVSQLVLAADILLIILRMENKDAELLCRHRHAGTKLIGFFGSAGAGVTAGTMLGGPVGGCAGLLIGAIFGKKITGSGGLTASGKLLLDLARNVKKAILSHSSSEARDHDSTKSALFAYKWAPSLSLAMENKNPGVVLCFHESRLICIITRKALSKDAYILDSFFSKDELVELRKTGCLDVTSELIVNRALLVLAYGFCTPEMLPAETPEPVPHNTAP